MTGNKNSGRRKVSSKERIEALIPKGIRYLEDIMKDKVTKPKVYKVGISKWLCEMALRGDGSAIDGKKGQGNYDRIIKEEQGDESVNEKG